MDVNKNYDVSDVQGYLKTHYNKQKQSNINDAVFPLGPQSHCWRRRLTRMGIAVK